MTSELRILNLGSSMSKRIAVLGASGSVGSAIAVHILRSRLLEPADTLLLVGHGIVNTERKLLSTRIDLLDAFDDERIRVEVVPDLGDVEADMIIVAAGATLSSACPTRRDLAATNRVVFDHIADQCASRSPAALYIVVSNPVELAVQTLSLAVDRKRVLGMGAQQDSLRFARAIASDLELSRHDVRASVLGEHGQAMLPLWRSVELAVDDRRAAERLATLCARAESSPLEARVAELRSDVVQLLANERIRDAYEATRRALPDARIFVEPFITAHSMHSTPQATANATLQCLTAVMANDRRQIHGQVRLDKEALDLEGVCGVPLTFGPAGWRADSLDWLTTEEATAVRKCSQSINNFVSDSVADTDHPAN